MLAKNTSKLTILKPRKNTLSVISPTLIKCPFHLPGSPPILKIEFINRIQNKYYLRDLEKKYDDFLEEKSQILLLLNLIDEVFEIRDIITLRINKLEREEKKVIHIRE